MTPAVELQHPPETAPAATPVVYRAAHPPQDPRRLLDDHRSAIRAHLHERGAVLFRGFDISSADQFDRFARLVAPESAALSQESSPRTHLEGAVYTSTDYPADYPIQFHTEYSYAHEWPMLLFFCCLQAPRTGGATPLASTRRVLERLGTTTRDRFERTGVLYVRNYLPNLGVPWQTAFGTDDRADVDRYCADAGIETTWRPDGVLTTRQVAPAIAHHPDTGDPVWFNHAFFFNVHALEPEDLREVILLQEEQDLSTNTYYGDGEPIPAATIDELRRAFAAERTRFDWQPADVLLIDNMLTAHSREPYTGPRSVLVVMGETQRRPDLPRRVAPAG